MHPQAGFFGKLPFAGDFVQRGLDGEFVTAWDAWLQPALHASRELLDEDWLELYLQGPVWRFAAAPGVLATRHTTVGIVIPSVDAVGRYFPFTVAAALDPALSALRAGLRAQGWLRRVEALALSWLEAQRGDADACQAQLQELDELLPRDAGPAIPASLPAVLDAKHLQVPLSAADGLGEAALAWLDAAILQSHPSPMSWWTDGSGAVAPSWLVTRGLPEAGAFAALLDGDWSRHPWQVLGGTVAGSAREAAPLRFETAGCTHVGHRRSVNEDAWIARDDLGVWVVADGMGGHRHGERASSMVCDAMAGLAPAATLRDLVRQIDAALGAVNRYLYESSGGDERAVCGSTVVALAARRDRAVCLWAGDSRLYRLRAGSLTQLTADHQETWSGATGGAGSHVISRAVGGLATLELDTHTLSVRAGDRWLLCSDGVSGPVPHEKLVQILRAAGSARSAAEAIIAEVLRGPADDNATALVIDVLEAG